MNIIHTYVRSTVAEAIEAARMAWKSPAPEVAELGENGLVLSIVAKRTDSNQGQIKVVDDQMREYAVQDYLYGEYEPEDLADVVLAVVNKARAVMASYKRAEARRLAEIAAALWSICREASDIIAPFTPGGTDVAASVNELLDAGITREEILAMVTAALPGGVGVLTVGQYAERLVAYGDAPGAVRTYTDERGRVYGASLTEAPWSGLMGTAAEQDALVARLVAAIPAPAKAWTRQELLAAPAA